MNVSIDLTILFMLSRLFPVVTTFSVTIGDNREKNTVVISGGNWEVYVPICLIIGKDPQTLICRYVRVSSFCFLIICIFSRKFR